MTYLPQDVARLARRGADAALTAEALEIASSEIAQAVRLHADPPATLAGFRSDARQVERTLLDLAAEWLYEAQTPELRLTEVITTASDHLLVDPAILGAELRIDDRRQATWTQLTEAVSLAIARVVDMPEGLGLLEVRQTLAVRGTWLALPRRPVVEVLSVLVDDVEVFDHTSPERDVLARPDGWGESVVVHYRAGYAVPRTEAPMAWRAEAAGELRRAWTTIGAGGFTPTSISRAGFELDHEKRGEDPEALLRRLSLDREPLDTRAREWLEEVRSGRRRLDIAPAARAARYVPRRRAPWVNRLYGRSDT